MSSELKKALAIVLGALGLIIVGAFIMLGISKLMSPAAPAATVAATPVAAPVAPAATIATTPPDAVTPVAPPGYVMVQVVNVQPHMVVRSIPYHTCHDVAHTEFAPPPNGTSGAGAVLGGVTGGLVGTQIGHGRGKTAAEIGGAVLGALAGNQIESNMNQPQPYTVYGTKCKLHYMQKSVQTGYDVTYTYNGQQGVTFMKTPPQSNVIPLALSPVAP